MIDYAISKMLEDIKDNNPLLGEIDIDKIYNIPDSDNLVKDYSYNKSNNEVSLLKLLLEKGEELLMNNVDYKELRKAIIKSCRITSEGKVSAKFSIDTDNLSTLAQELNLRFVKIGLTPQRIMPNNIPLLSEYFEKGKLSWLSDNKFFTTLTFVDVSDIDEETETLLSNLEDNSTENPDIDKVTEFAKIVASKHCYFATVISYRSNDPKWYNRLSYEIVCRANKVVIKDSAYQYNGKDF